MWCGDWRRCSNSPHMGRWYSTAHAMECALISIHCMWNLTHTKASERRKHVVYYVNKDSDYWGMKMIWFNNIFRMFPMVMIPGYLLNYSRSYPTTVNIRTKTANLTQVLMLENIDLLVLLALLQLLISKITKKVCPQNIFVARKEINVKSLLQWQKKLHQGRKNHYNNYGWGSPKGGIVSMASTSVLEKKKHQGKYLDTSDIGNPPSPLRMNYYINSYVCATEESEE